MASKFMAESGTVPLAETGLFIFLPFFFNQGESNRIKPSRTTGDDRGKNNEQQAPNLRLRGAAPASVRDGRNPELET